MFFMFKLLKSFFNTFLVGGDSWGGRQYFDIQFRFSKRDLPHLPPSPFLGWVMGIHFFYSAPKCDCPEGKTFAACAM